MAGQPRRHRGGRGVLRRLGENSPRLSFACKDLTMPKVSHEILSWARETAGLSLHEAVGKLGIWPRLGVSAVDRLAAIEAGEVEPTRQLLLKMAQHYRRPLVTFYMSAPPRKGDRGQDFRNVPDRHTRAEALVDALVRDIRARQSMVRAVLVDDEEAKPLSFIGSMTMGEGVGAVLASIRQIIRIDSSEFRAQTSPESAFALLQPAPPSGGAAGLAPLGRPRGGPRRWLARSRAVSPVVLTRARWREREREKARRRKKTPILIIRRAHKGLWGLRW
jgi:transcriptional regulator with XRE-family HTH domain